MDKKTKKVFLIIIIGLILATLLTDHLVMIVEDGTPVQTVGGTDGDGTLLGDIP